LRYTKKKKKSFENTKDESAWLSLGLAHQRRVGHGTMGSRGRVEPNNKMHLGQILKYSLKISKMEVNEPNVIRKGGKD
jgi:hypothetical protein